MRFRLVFLLCGCSGMSAIGLAELHSHQASDEKRIRWLLNSGEFKDEREELTRMGEKAFFTYRAVLSDREAKPHEVGRIFLVLREVKGDRVDFVEHVVQRLAHPNNDVRRSAVLLIGDIGSPRDASPLVALLSDTNKVIVNAAATALGAIGGPREVIAMDAWLLGSSHADDAHLRNHVRKCRDALKKRLDDARAKSKS